MPELEKAVALDPEKSTAHELLGKLYQDAGRQQEAIAQLEEAHRLQPKDREAIYRLYRIYSTMAIRSTVPGSRRASESVAREKAESDRGPKAAILNNTASSWKKRATLPVRWTTMIRPRK